MKLFSKKVEMLEKRVLTALLSAAMCIGVAACGQKPSMQSLAPPSLTPETPTPMLTPVIPENSIFSNDEYYITQTELADEEWSFSGAFFDGLAAVYSGEKYGFIDTAGKVVVPLEYDAVYEYTNGFAWVCKEEKWGLVDTTGKIILPLEYDTVYEYTNGLTLTQKDKKCGLLDAQRNVIASNEYDGIGYFNDDLALAIKGDKYGFINALGEVVVPIEYDNVRNYTNGFAWVCKEEKWALVDTTGKILTSLKYDEADDFHDGLAAVKYNGKYGFIDTNGTLIIKFIHDWVSSFDGGTALVWDGVSQKYSSIDKSGTITSKPYMYSWLRTYGYHENGLFYADVPSINKHRLIDENGNMVANSSCDEIVFYNDNDRSSIFFNEFATLKEGTLYGAIDAKGNIAAATIYENPIRFTNGVAVAQKDGLAGVIDTQGNTIIPFEYDYIVFESFDAVGLWLVIRHDKWTYLDPDGNEILDWFDNASIFNTDGIATYTQDGKHYLLEKISIKD
ncbi:MAG: WG repeat-containing protein [Oscillospiraceae bacterium]|jgi:hypothetical protein|nr:WG repeat-containing protein [Oscillospiraceae bacterium]